MHASPAHNWTVSELAAKAHVSRSSLSALFRRLVGVSPIAYLARWRLLLAARILRDEGLSIREVADRVGYEADAAFSRASSGSSALRRERTASGRRYISSTPYSVSIFGGGGCARPNARIG